MSLGINQEYWMVQVSKPLGIGNSVAAGSGFDRIDRL